MDSPRDGTTGDRNSPVSPDAYAELVAGIEAKVSDTEQTTLIFYGPTWAQAEGADPPPEDLSEPVWAPGAGWVEKGAAGGILTLYAPDSIDSDTTPSGQ